MGKTSIEWTGRTWNPVSGCDPVSPGCDHCYAETIARRFAGTKAYPNGFKVTLRPERLSDPFRWRTPQRVFTNSMSDLFHDDIPDEYIARVFAVMALTPQHTYQVLTKRPGRMRSLLSGRAIEFRSQMCWAATEHNPELVPGMPNNAGHRVFHETDWPLPNLWLGVSAENQKWADVRIPVLLDTPAAVRFLSAEPLLAPIDLHGELDPTGQHRPKLSYWLTGRPDWGTDGTLTVGPRLDWVIAGGESGPGARPMHPDWVRSLRDQCTGSGVAFFFKQWGGRTAKTNGRELDGRTWDEYPQEGQ